MDTSVYKYIRPVFVFCALLGSFCATNIFHHDSIELKFKYISFPVAVFCFQRCMVIHFISSVVQIYLKSNGKPLGTITHAFLTLFETFWMASQLLGSKQVIRALQSIDKIRNTLIHNMYRPNKPIANPIVFSSVVLFVLFAVHLSPLYWGTHVAQIHEGSWQEFAFFSICLCFPFRLCTLYSCVYYSCALVVYDTVQIWCRQSNAKPLQSGFLSSFCSLIANQIQLLKEIDELLQDLMFSLLVHRIVIILTSGLHFLEKDLVMSSKIVFFIQWVIFHGLVFLVMNLASDEYEKLEQEVFLLRTSDILKEESVKVRVLLVHLDNKPGLFTVGRFVEGGPSLLMAVTSFGIEYLITLLQNMDMLKKLTGVTPELLDSINKI